jgi:hypothetical protein
MDTLNLRQYKALGPFEIKNELAAPAPERPNTLSVCVFGGVLQRF